MIDRGADIETWKEEAPELVGKRELAIQKLREQLMTPQRSPTKIRKPFYQWTEWEVGHVIAYRLLSGKWVLFKVVHIEKYKDKSRTPIVHCCDWVGKNKPEIGEIKKLDVHMGESFDLRKKFEPVNFSLCQSAKSQYPEDRVQVVATGLKTRRTNNVNCWYFGGWRELDSFLKRHFGYE